MQLEQQRREETERAGKALDDREAAHAALKQTDRELKQAVAEQAREQALLKEVSSQRTEAADKQAQLDVEVDELKEKEETSTADEV